MRKALRFAARIFTEDKSRKSRRSQSRRLIVEPLESRRLLTGDLPFFVPQVDALPAAIASQVVPVQQAQTDSVALAAVGVFFRGLGNGLYHMGSGVYTLGHDLVTMPIDLVGTAVSSSYEPLSYYGQSSQAAIQSGIPCYYISGQTAVNAGTFGTYSLATTGYQWYQTGDPTAFEQTTGPFAFTVFVSYGVQQYTSTANAPTYNLGGVGEVPGAINVQPPTAPLPPKPYIIAPSNQLPIPPGSGNVVVNSSPISPQTGFLGPPYSPNQISIIATGGYTISITQGVPTPGLPTIGQTAVINVVPPGSQVVVTPVPPYMTSVVITTPSPLTTALAPYAPIVIQGPNPQLGPINQ